MITCEHARERLAPEPGPRPTNPDIEEAFGHYATCARCQAFFESQRALTARVRHAGESVSAPVDLAERVLAALDAEAPVPRRPRGNLWMAGLAVASAAVLALWLGPPLGSDPLAARPFLDQALAEDGLARAMLASGTSQLSAWFQTQDIDGFSIPEIENAQMLRGRVTWVGGSRSAAVDFETPDGIGLTYIMVPGPALFGGVRESGIMTMSADGWEVAMWVEEGTARAVLSRMPRTELMAIAEQCKNKRAL